jgi:hypothetical protein
MPCLCYISFLIIGHFHSAEKLIYLKDFKKCEISFKSSIHKIRSILSIAIHLCLTQPDLVFCWYQVVRVHYPGLESHPEHYIAKRQMSGFGGVISFEV